MPEIPSPQAIAFEILSDLPTDRDRRYRWCVPIGCWAALRILGAEGADGSVLAVLEGIAETKPRDLSDDDFLAIEWLVGELEESLPATTASCRLDAGGSRPPVSAVKKSLHGRDRIRCPQTS